MNFEELYTQIRKRLDDSVSSTIGLVGLPGSGKTTMSVNLGRYLSTQNIAAVPWEGDIYSTSSRANRTAVIQREFRDRVAVGLPIDPNWPRNAYHYNIPLMIEHFDKLKKREDFLANGLCHPKRKSIDLGIEVHFPNQRETDIRFEDDLLHYEGDETWILADFALLTKRGIREHLDLLVYVDAPYDVRADRIRTRLQNLPIPIIREENLSRSIEESQTHDFDVNPEVAQIVIDNTDFNNPRIVRA